jgi:hypothetical protein
VNPEWIYRLYKHARLTDGLPLLIHEIEAAMPSYVIRFDLEQQLGNKFKPKRQHPFATEMFNYSVEAGRLRKVLGKETK